MPVRACGQCGFRAVRKEGARFCTRCGALLPDSAQVFPTIAGPLLMLSGLGIYLWARGHSPHMGFGEAIVALGSDPHAYYIKEPFYSLIVLFAAALGLWGLVTLVRELRNS